jgi:hypothetical protein
MRRAVTGVRAIAAVALAAAMALPASGAWRLRLTLAEGDVHRFALTHSQSMDFDLNGVEQKVENTLRLEIRQSVQRRLEDGSFALETIYERMRTAMNAGGMKLELDTAQPGGDEHPMAKFQRQLIGKPFVVTTSPLGQVQDVDGIDVLLQGMAETLDPGMRPIFDQVQQAFGEEAMKSMIQQCGLTYPERDLGPGDTWQQRVVMPNPALGELRIASEYRIEGREVVREQERVKIAVTSTLEFGSGAPTFSQLGKLFGTAVDVDVASASGSGLIWVDPASGLVVESRLDQQMELNLAFEIPGQGDGQAQKVAMHGRIAQHTRVEQLPGPELPGSDPGSPDPD